MRSGRVGEVGELRPGPEEERRPALSDEAAEPRAAYRHAACARESLVNAHRPLVEQIVDRFLPRSGSVRREDLVQEGIIGLIKAIDNFDPERGAPLEAYASRLIAGHIQHYLRDRAGLVRRRRKPDRAELHEVISLDSIGAVGENVGGERLVTDGGLGDEFATRYALGCLSPVERQALEMRFVDRLGLREIAAELGLDVLAATAAIEEACAQLGRALGLEPDAWSSGARFDPVSGLLSRPAFLRRLQEELELAASRAEVLSVAVLDLSRMSATDAHSQQRALRAVGEVLHSRIRRTDVAGRWEDHRFALALPRTDLAGCNATLDRVVGILRQTVPLSSPRAGAAIYPRDAVEAHALLSVAASRVRRRGVGLARAA